MTNGHTRFAVSICLLFLVVFNRGFAKPYDSTAASPTGVILVPATVEGQPVTFLLDTGAERSCLDARLAAQLQLRSASVESIRQPYATGVAGGIRVGDLGIESFHLQDMDMLSSDLSAISLGVGVHIDGILGSDVLRRFTVKLDFSSGSAQFGSSVITPVDGTVVRLHSADSLYFVPLTVQGTPIELLLDTGTNASSVSSHAWSHITMCWQPQSMIDGIRSTGVSEGLKFALIPTIEIGGVTSKNIPLRIQPQTRDGLFADAGFEGLLGSDVLRQFIVTLDLANHRMYLTNDPNSHPDQYLFSTIGIQFAKDVEGGFTIMAVWNPSPAAKAGLKIGDRILAVNEVDTRQMSLDDLSRQIHGRPGTEVHLVIDSNGHRYSVPMAISCLLCQFDSSLKNK
jgi:predicted aspartyl protease